VIGLDGRAVILVGVRRHRVEIGGQADAGAGWQRIRLGIGGPERGVERVGIERIGAPRCGGGQLHLHLERAETQPVAVTQPAGGAGAERVRVVVQKRPVAGQIRHLPIPGAKRQDAVLLRQMPVRVRQHPVILGTAADTELAPLDGPCLGRGFGRAA